MPFLSASALLMLSSVVSALWVTSLGVRKSVYTSPMGFPSGSFSPAMITLGSFFGESSSDEHAVNTAVVASIAAISNRESSLFFLIVV